MRFGLFIPQGWRLDLVGVEPADQWGVMSSVADRAESGGWDSIWVYDHFHTVPLPTDEATHEAWTLVAALAATTSRVEIGQMCTAMGYRNPMYLAKVAATADLISGGRVQMGIGGGWYEHEWRAYGYGFPSAGERLARLDEGVQIMKQAWETGRATLDGKHYTVDDAICAPQPTAGRLPLWIAGGGEKKTLRIAAKYADYTNFDGTPDGFAHKSSVLQQHCADLGRDFESITRSANYNVMLGETEADVERKLTDLEARLSNIVGPDAASGSLGAFRGMPGVGTPEQVAENLRGLADAGMSYGICYFPNIAVDREDLEMFEQRVIPALR
ncbi:LLM class F420-dependent oxidoreductase [Gordonia hongkongensis]|uniref:LLM class F420-dependent oxidoreductase n=1 Tax=Gordonia hongkongensis TaxID=1701090 RepID=A0AAX3TAH3_9ACTN|nr:LLM class F420-dependent oxidoreductase [Gordonia hongkongensis]MDF6099815.1 LLM class F420-dependent oxidoreductase [Gordonia hongkongensis]QIK49129.1 LLM class F420-dependent oxidoreductase [Gordonia terrae]WFP25962.1 LLM class F420-dependent oxidoreductase [Gordonia hongkongensis]